MWKALLFFSAGICGGWWLAKKGGGAQNMPLLSGGGGAHPYDALLVGKVDNKQYVKTTNTSFNETLATMHYMARKFAGQTAPLARFLHQNHPRPFDTLQAIYNFCLRYFNYKNDTKGREELRTPLRAWHDRLTGIDCDCFALFIASLLHNLHIPFLFRVVAYNQKKQPQHVYPVAIIDNNTHIPIDPVERHFNSEKKYTYKIDFHL